MEAQIHPSKRESGKIALVVDDNPAIRKIVATAFLSHGFKTCLEAKDGREGLQAVRQFRPDVISLDLSMPVMNGLTAAAEIRKIFPDVPIILFTSYGESLSKSDVSKSGINVVLPKTAPLSTLVDKAYELMGNQP